MARISRPPETTGRWGMRCGSVSYGEVDHEFALELYVVSRRELLVAAYRHSGVIA